MGEWSFLSGLFDHLQAHSPMLGRFWLLLMLVFRILILGTVASDMFEDEQEEFACNTLQPGCKQRTSASKAPRDYRETRQLRRLYIVHVAFRLFAEVSFLVGQWWLYGFKVEAQYPCDRFPCPYTVDCFTSRPAEKTVFLCFYFTVGVLSAISSCVELLYSSTKWFCCKRRHSSDPSARSYKSGELPEMRLQTSVASSGKTRRSSHKSDRKGARPPHRNGKHVNDKTFVV
ncbi:gap junction delta-3 protein-like isoform X2 [Hippocampus zosterae]|uniref:gap junction delta-3 protein-like isoform X2 n=1 Tax=Hippocampus zosterae TaxID=109293 RepID=UPI00223CE03F|nr:gap junction delta-3 protein-like isoform X2 [Hippocampus zosterae]